MKRPQKYLSSEAHGYLQEAEACSLILKDLERISAKLQRRIDKEAAARQADFEAAMQYHSEAEIQDAYGWDFITEAQYHAYLDLFRRGREAIEDHPPTISEMALSIVRKVIRDLRRTNGNVSFPLSHRSSRSWSCSVQNRPGKNGRHILPSCGRNRAVYSNPRIWRLHSLSFPAPANGQRPSLQRDRQTVPLWSAGPFLYKGVEYEEKTISPNAEEIHRND